MKSFFVFTLTVLIALLCNWFVLPSAAQAGYIEVGASGTYRKSNFDPNAYDQSYSLSASLSYLFSDSTAMEFSYTDGFSKRYIPGVPGVGDQLTTVHTQFAGLDYVFTFGDKDATFRPYIKAGGGYLFKKKLVSEITGFSTSDDVQSTHPGWVPSAGAGLRIALTQKLSLKVGFDAWTSDPLGYGKVSHIDMAARVGFSWLF